MSKTKTKSSEVTTLPKTDPRKAMLSVRTRVKASIRDNRRVDQLDLNPADTTRSQIALQDMLADSQARHKKATNHIANLVDVLGTTYKEVSMLMVEHEIELMMLHETIQSQMSKIAKLENTCDSLEEGWAGAINENVDLQNNLNGMRTTLRNEMINNG